MFIKAQNIITAQELYLSRLFGKHDYSADEYVMIYDRHRRIMIVVYIHKTYAGRKTQLICQVSSSQVI